MALMLLFLSSIRIGMSLVRLLIFSCVSIWQWLAVSLLILGILPLHLLATLLITLLRTLLTAIRFVAFLHLLIMTDTRICVVRTLCSRLLVCPSLGTKRVLCTMALIRLPCLELWLLKTWWVILPRQIIFIMLLRPLVTIGTWSNFECRLRDSVRCSAPLVLTYITLAWGITILWVRALLSLNMERSTRCLLLLTMSLVLVRLSNLCNLVRSMNGFRWQFPLGATVPFSRTSREANGFNSLVRNWVGLEVVRVTGLVRRRVRACGVIFAMMQLMKITIVIVRFTRY